VAARLSIRIDLAGACRVGPGKMRLLELIDETGSISAAGRAMAMSYRRAWLLVESLNSAFRAPVVAAQPGGRRGGGASLTPAGRALLERYRTIERTAAAAVEPHLAALEAALKPVDEAASTARGAGQTAGRQGDALLSPPRRGRGRWS
jgi:molybdate transport system regulatory protein